MRKRGIHKALALVLALIFISSTVAFAFDEPDDDQLLIPDLLLGKPLGLIALGFGGLTYIVTLPVTIPCGWREKAAESLVKKPYRFTFKRELGDDLNSW
jgi:hypothetical protein